MNHVGPDDLLAPEWLSDGMTVYIRKENTPTAIIWIPAKVITAMGDRARVATRVDGEIVDVWRSLSALRVKAPAA
jgi:hypothetical protein